MRMYKRGIIYGFLFGTLGVFLLALISLISPIAEMIATPFLWPGRFLASIMTGDTASTWMVLLLYLMTGIMYALIGIIVQMIVRALKGRQKSDHIN